MQKPNLLKPVFQLFPEAARLVSESKCPLCEKVITEEEFTDELSKREYSFSGLCQTCQDKLFN